MASVFERLRTIALTVRSETYDEDRLIIPRSNSLLLPEKPYRIIQKTQRNEETPKIYERRLSKRDISQQLLAMRPKSNQDDRTARPRILRGLSATTKLDTCFIKTVDDFAVISSSNVPPLLSTCSLASLSIHQDSPENTYRSDSSSEESPPPPSTRLGIGPAPCFLEGRSTDEDRDESDRGVQQHLKYYLPNSNRSFETNSWEQPDTGSLVVSSSVRRTSSFIIESPRIGSHENKERGSAEDSQILMNTTIAYMQPSTPIHPIRSVSPPLPRGTNIDDVEWCLPPEQVGKISPMKWYDDPKLKTKAWSDAEVVVISYGDKKQGSLLKFEKNKEEDAPATCNLGNFDTNDDYKFLCGSEHYSDTESKQQEYMHDMLSLFNNPEWVQAEDLCPISSLGSLGRGAGGGVTGVFHIPTCMIYALKSTSQWSEIDTFVILKEALGDQRTPQLMNLYGLFEDINSNEKALVLEYMDLGSLHDHFLSKGKRCTEKQVKHIARETLLGLQQLHSFETPIIHRDVKPHNILIESGGSVRVADYGLLFSLRDKKQQCTDMAGTSKYFSPERHNGNFSMPSDIWALGVTLLECFLGKILDPKDLEDVKVAGGQVHPLEFLDECEIRLSDEALNFLKCCLSYWATKRWDANMLLQHAFLQSPYPDKTDIFVPKRKKAANEKLLKEILEIIQTFIRLNMEGESSQKDVWTNVKGISHEKRLSNIARWTGFTKTQIEEYVMHLYNERTHPRSRF